MNVLKRCCYRSMRENRKRTSVTIIGIVLATALITGVACMAVSFRASLILYEKLENGDYHYGFMGVAPENLKYFENNEQIERFGVVEELGYAVLEGSQNPDKPYVFVCGIDEMSQETLSLQLVQGRMPENDRELVIGRHIRSNGLVDLKVGDELTLSMGNRISEGHRLTQESPYLYEEETLETDFERTFTVVGIIERPIRDVEPFIAPGYSVFTRMGDPAEAGILNVYATYTDSGLKQREQVTAGILGVSEELYRRYYGFHGGLGTYTEQEEEQIRHIAWKVTENYWVLKWELMIFSSGAMNMLYGMSVIAVSIIIVTSVFCIHNSFVISLTEKMKLYGRLASVGTTAGQQRRIVYYEAAFLGGIGIPLGILSGIGATAVLVRAVGGLVEDALGFSLVFAMSFPAIALSVVLSGITVFFSSFQSARKAARISPISAIRANDTVRIRRRELRCPKAIGRVFGIGERIAYKNLRRARVKYRTTVVSIVVSVAVFIGMSTFVELIFDINGVYNNDSMPYQMQVYLYDYESAVRIASLDGVQEAEIVRPGILMVDGGETPFTKEYEEKHKPEATETIQIRALGEEAYARFCKKVGVTVEEARDKAIVIADYVVQYKIDGVTYVDECKIAEFHKGDVIIGAGADEGLEVEVLTQTSEKPMYLSNGRYNKIVLVVSNEWYDSQNISKFDNVEIYIKCEDSDALETAIRNDIQLGDCTVTNYDAVYRANRSMYLVVAIFLYGFITVVALIGITNIFNTITTNMELRAPEFAMLRSVGMTGKEFRRMIWLEGMFYGGKALIIAIPLGVVISYCFHMAMSKGVVLDFCFPFEAILTALAAVSALLFSIMHYSMGKVNRKNIIETIQNENI